MDDAGHELLRLETLLHVDICGMDQLAQSRIINRLTGPELDVAHELAGAFEQTVRIGKFGAKKKPDVDVSLERVGVGECRVSYTCGWMTVMQQLTDIVSTVAHDFEPAPRDFPQFVRMRAHPCLDGSIPLDGTGKSHQSTHCAFHSCRVARQVQLLVRLLDLDGRVLVPGAAGDTTVHGDIFAIDAQLAVNVQDVASLMIRGRPIVRSNVPGDVPRLGLRFAPRHQITRLGNDSMLMAECKSGSGQ